MSRIPKKSYWSYLNPTPLHSATIISRVTAATIADPYTKMTVEPRAFDWCVVLLLLRAMVCAQMAVEWRPRTFDADGKQKRHKNHGKQGAWWVYIFGLQGGDPYCDLRGEQCQDTSCQGDTYRIYIPRRWRSCRRPAATSTCASPCPSGWKRTTWKTRSRHSQVWGTSWTVFVVRGASWTVFVVREETLLATSS